jgi:type IV secretion system protein VirB1
LGLAQINSANLSRLGLTIDTVFEPCRNIHGAALLLRECYGRASRRYGEGQPALQAALSCYNTNSLSRGFSNGYVQKVVASTAGFVPAIDPRFPVPFRSRGVGIAVTPSAAPPGKPPGPRLLRPRVGRSRGVTVIRGTTGG